MPGGPTKCWGTTTALTTDQASSRAGRSANPTVRLGALRHRPRSFEAGHEPLEVLPEGGPEVVAHAGDLDGGLQVVEGLAAAVAAVPDRVPGSRRGLVQQPAGVGDLAPATDPGPGLPDPM